jgi:hypothetical protein
MYHTNKYIIRFFINYIFIVYRFDVIRNLLYNFDQT